MTIRWCSWKDLSYISGSLFHSLFIKKHSYLSDVMCLASSQKYRMYSLFYYMMTKEQQQFFYIYLRRYSMTFLNNYFKYTLLDLCCDRTNVLFNPMAATLSLKSIATIPCKHILMCVPCKSIFLTKSLPVQVTQGSWRPLLQSFSRAMIYSP